MSYPPFKPLIEPEPDYRKEYIDLWLVERILLENCFVEVAQLEYKLEHGLRIKNNDGRYIKTDLEAIKNRLS